MTVMLCLVAADAASRSSTIALRGHAITSQKLPDNVSSEVVGTGFWSGVACGAGIVALIGAASTGSAILGGPVGVYMTAVGTIAACSSALS
jgi:hypothetical protein